MSFTMSTTGLIVTIVVIALGIYDLIVVLRRGTGSSISNYLINVGLRSPVVVFAFGFICGHLFGYMWPEDGWNCPPKEATQQSAALLNKKERK